MALVATVASAQNDSNDQIDDYRIAPGDRIAIHVYDEPDLSFSELPIPSDGMFTFPFIGEVQAAGRTEEDLASEIAARLRDGYLLHPQVTVSVTGYRPIYVSGGVAQPGKKTFVIGMNVEKVIALSGGFTDDADLDTLAIQRSGPNGKVELEASLATPVQPGDIVSVKQVEIVEKPKQYFFLYGEVARPGQYEYREGLSVEKAIIIAGGFGLRASKRKITITRGDPEEKFKKVPLNTRVEPGDVITIGTSLF